MAQETPRKHIKIIIGHERNLKACIFDIFLAKIITGHHIYDVGLSAHLTCRDGGNSVQWLFNGTLANISQFGAIEDKRTDNLVLLRLDNISLHFNNTRFQCRSAGLTSNEVMIQVRGM